MEINRDNIFEIINKSNTRPDKDYGQNFLVEPSVSKEIVDALDINSEDYVLEIGPGLGSLTHFIALSGAKTAIVDIDRRMTDFLSVVYQDQKQLSIINEDIRKVNTGEFSKIIGNLPYNITTELVVYLLKYAKKAKKMVLMCQSEAFNHFNDVSGKEYGPASILVHLLGDIKKLRLVKGGSFHPVPKCSSLVFEINLSEDVNKEKALDIYNMVKQLFINRRKTIYNSLTNYLKNRDLAESICKEINIPLQTRAEEISPNKYVELFNEVKKKESK